MKVFNFNAGPAMLPVAVMEKVKDEFLNYQNSGMSIMEMSHRGKHFEEILNRAESSLRTLLSIPNNYSVAFFPGGASFQFSAIPMNLLDKNEFADYSLTGVWSNKAITESRKLGFGANAIFDGKSKNFKEIPELTENDISPNAKYLYITSNNTIYGTQYKNFPKIKSIPLIADMTSDLLSKEINVNDFGIIFAGAQKNIGPSGLTVVIIKNELLEWKKNPVPVLLDYKLYFGNKSLYNTPPTFSIYIAGLVFDWCIEMGGLKRIEEINNIKANKLYDFIENSNLYKLRNPRKFSSTMNIVFTLENSELNKKFISDSEANGLEGLAGHRDAGGMRASIYNAMPIEGVDKLIQFMSDFESSNK